MRFLGLIILCASSSAFSANYDAASCSLSAVQSAYATEQASKADGDIIAIPNCTSTTWSSSWTISPTNTLTFQGNTTVTGSCSPGGSCTPTDSTIIALGNAVQFTVNVASGKTFRLTGMTINPSGSAAQYGSLSFNGNNNLASVLRIDHCHFNDTVGGDHTIQPDSLTGVVDHNYFDSTNQANLFFIQPTIDGSDGESNATWTVQENFGTNQFLFVENNFFQNGAFLFDCDFGGRLVFRFNTGWYNTRIQTHGTGSGAQRRGCRAMEIYENTFTYSNNPNTNSFAFLVDYESGPGMFWGNTVTAFVTLWREQEVRADNSTYTQTSTPSGWGYCGTAYNGAGTNWDQNSNGSTGYACLDQVGRGAGQLLSGSFPNLVNQAAGIIAWPNQALVPTYAWSNTQNTNSYATNHYWQTYESPVRVTENIDYYLEIPNVDEVGSFNGTHGIGHGTLASKPSTCTPSVGWWATDQGSWNASGNGAGNGGLYVCSSSNTWTAHYSPYTYPHPLTQGPGQGPAAPTGLEAIVH